MTRNSYGELIREWTDDGWTLHAYRSPDEFADTSFLGEYFESSAHKSSNPSAYLSESCFQVRAVPTRSGPLFGKRATIFYRPQRGCESHWREDERRLRAYYAEEWGMDALTVIASREGVELGRASLGGVESDNSEENVQHILGELAGEALDEARERLARLCGSATKSTEAKGAEQ